MIQREELTKLLMALGTAESKKALSTAGQTALSSILTTNGISDPEGTLKAIRAAALDFEKDAPELSHAVRQTKAILKVTTSDFVGKINSWFDQTMDRTSQRFTASTRAITFVGAFIVAFGLQVDTVMVYNRLSADDVLREQLVAQARQLPPLATREGQTPEQAAADEAKYRTFLSEAGIISLPSNAGWRNTWKSIYAGDYGKAGGMLITALLLSLGAPFWYGALQNLLKLRSVLAQKDDQQRQERQTATPGGVAGSKAS